ncbi:solute carrier family 13 member 5 [Aphelenchoides avenae]|nr:solute carrier family 13 member 5 [Aphelenchus avenae]
MMLPIVLKVISELERCRKQKSRAHEADIEDGRSGIIAVASSAELVQDELDLDAMESADRSVYKGLLLSICYAASIGGTGTLVGTGPNLILVENLGKSFPKAKISFAKWMLFAVPSMLILLAFCWIWLQSVFIGFNFKKRDRVQEKAVEQVLRKKYDSLGPIRFDEVMVLSTFAVLIVLWLTRSPGFTTGWGDLYPKQ